MAFYPKDLIALLKKKIPTVEKIRYSKPPNLPSDMELQILLETAFHASLLTEEGRRPGFRIIYISKKEAEKETDMQRTGKYFSNESKIIPLDSLRPYSVSEINRLAPAAELTRLLICVANYAESGEKPELFIWGLLDVGENWWKFIHHETSGGKPPPNFITLTSSNPGELSISAQGEIYFTLKNGNIVQPRMNALWSGTINDFLQNARKQLYNETVKELGVKKWDEEDKDDDYPHRLYNYFLERILFYIREKAHGGTLIIIPNYINKNDTRITDRIIIKYACSYNYAWSTLKYSLKNHRRYYDLHFPLWDGKTAMTVENFRQHHMLSEEDQEIAEGLGDAAQAIASLTSIDGAVLLDDNFSILGFGCEIIATSSSLKEIVVNTRVSPNEKMTIESFGTRHRAAFRFCSSFEDSIAFVVSQDGGVKAIKRVGSDVVLWPDINTGAMGI